ncbi:MAG: 1,5-anhydro-D-fructose reductase [candidate division BRC1 bacterium ADurb.BinA292]|nr:MAG: 1,5-anhydro-D-fructose reductase [candidate division BRC1 bacterium ADurb.BinA292]
MLNIGIIGLGKMGRIRAAEIARHPRTQLVLAADPDPAAADTLPGLTVTRDWRELIDAELDAVVVCAPNDITAAAVIAALRAGRHVLSEKPPGRNLAEVEAIRRAAAARPDLKLKFGFNHRYHAGIREAKRIIDAGRLGRILWLRGIYGKCGGPGFEHSWRSDRQRAGGGILLDQGIHMLDLFRYFCGDFVEVKSMVATAHWPISVEDNAFALLRDPHGRIAMLHSSSTQWKNRFHLEIFLSEGYLSINGLLTSSRSYGDESITVARKQFDDGFATGKPREEIIYFDTDPSWELELAEFVDCIENDQPVRHGTIDDALAVMRMVYAIYEDDGAGAGPCRVVARPLADQSPPEPAHTPPDRATR